MPPSSRPRGGLEHVDTTPVQAIADSALASELMALADDEMRRMPGSPAPIRVKVPAKINLHLAVGHLGGDGYHELSTVYEAVSLYDELSATPAESLSLSITGEG